MYGRTWTDSLLLMTLVGVSLVVIPLARIAVASPSIDGPVLVIGAPWGAHPADIIHQANALEIGPTTAPLAAFAQVNTLEQLALLRDAGAWAVLDGRMLAAICGVNGNG